MRSLWLIGLVTALALALALVGCSKNTSNETRAQDVTRTNSIISGSLQIDNNTYDRLSDAVIPSLSIRYLEGNTIKNMVVKSAWVRLRKDFVDITTTTSGKDHHLLLNKDQVVSMEYTID